MSTALTPIERTNEERAIALLAEGFPERDVSFWREAFERMRALGWNAAAGVPLGQLLISGGDPVGIMLTPASLRTFPDGTRRRMINLSSWFIRPEHRWRGLAMMRRLTAGDDAVYTDMTPTVEMHKMLLAAGFRQLNKGVIVDAVPLRACRPGNGGRVLELEGAPKEAISDELRAFLSGHRTLGCLPAALEVEGRWHPLLFKLGRWRRLPSAELLFAPSAATASHALGAISRFLLRQGVLVSLRDCSIEEADPPRGLRTHGIKFAKLAPHDAHLLRDRIDHAGTELAILDH